MQIRLVYGEILWSLYNVSIARKQCRKWSLHVYLVWTNWNSFVKHSHHTSYTEKMVTSQQSEWRDMGFLLYVY